MGPNEYGTRLHSGGDADALLEIMGPNEYGTKKAGTHWSHRRRDATSSCSLGEYGTKIVTTAVVWQCYIHSVMCNASHPN